MTEISNEFGPTGVEISDMQALKGLVALVFTAAFVFTVTLVINHHTERAYVLKSMQQTASATTHPGSGMSAPVGNKLVQHKAAPKL